MCGKGGAFRRGLTTRHQTVVGAVVSKNPHHLLVVDSGWLAVVTLDLDLNSAPVHHEGEGAAVTYGGRAGPAGKGRVDVIVAVVHSHRHPLLTLHAARAVFDLQKIQNTNSVEVISLKPCCAYQ